MSQTVFTRDQIVIPKNKENHALCEMYDVTEKEICGNETQNYTEKEREIQTDELIPKHYDRNR